MLSYEYPCDHQTLTEWWAILSWISPYPPHLASIIIRVDPVHEPRPTSVQPRKHLLVRAVAWDGVRDVKTSLHDLTLCTVLSNCPNKRVRWYWRLPWKSSLTMIIPIPPPREEHACYLRSSPTHRANYLLRFYAVSRVTTNFITAETALAC